MILTDVAAAAVAAVTIVIAPQPPSISTIGTLILWIERLLLYG
jgi:hypothetical protein